MMQEEENNMASDTKDAGAQNADAAHKEAIDYWGYLIKPEKCWTELFNRLLRGIADVIMSRDATADFCFLCACTRLCTCTPADIVAAEQDIRAW
jgi:hypothetical protein